MKGSSPRRRTRRHHLLALVSILGLASGVLVAGARFAQAGPGATIVVDSLADTTGGPSCTLRDAITSANTDASTGGCPAGNALDPDTIVFEASLGTGSVSLESPLPHVTGDLTIDGSAANITIDGQRAVRGLHTNATVLLEHLTVAGGSAGRGGGIYNGAGALTISDSSVSGNTASSDGGGIYDRRGDITITNSTVSNNSALSNGGGIYGGGHGTLMITKSSVSVNSALSSSGGGIYNAGAARVFVSKSTLWGNSASHDGGGVYNTGGTITISNSTMSGGSVSYDGGGIYDGGGSLAVSSSTLSGNVADGSGGGIFHYRGPLTVANSTVSGNTASLDGGGILHRRGPLALSNTTVSGNGASHGGGLANLHSATLTASNTIVANSPAGDDCDGQIAGSADLADDGTCGPGFTTVTSAELDLGTLADNGGATETIALGPNSSAIDAGDDAVCAAPPVNGVDQRGVVRPQRVDCDIGSFELA